MHNHNDYQVWILQLQKELHDILSFWMTMTPDKSGGGFVGRMCNDNTAEPGAEKGLILNSRIMWTFAAATHFTRNTEYLNTAKAACDYLEAHFYDQMNGGFYWMVDSEGRPADSKKKVYGQAFVIYAYAELVAATQDSHYLKKAKDLFFLLESKCIDLKYDGYFEAYEAGWHLAEDLRLSEKDMNEKKSMNNHLHILEAYTNLYRVWKEESLAQRLEALIRIFLTLIINRKTFHLNLFFDESWQSKSNVISFGHDIETTWLLHEAAGVLGNANLMNEVENVIIKMADVTFKQGLDEDGALLYEGLGPDIIDDEKHWWPQAEAAVGFLNAFQLSGEERFYNAARNVWRFIQKSLMDKEYGEWFYRTTRDGEVVDEYKVSEWKGPYHNGRACMELIRRLESIKRGEER